MYTRSAYISTYWYSAIKVTLVIRGSATQDAICHKKNSKGYEVNPDLQEPMIQFPLELTELESAYSPCYKKLVK